MHQKRKQRGGENEEKGETTNLTSPKSIQVTGKGVFKGVSTTDENGDSVENTHTRKKRTQQQW
jgi:hypothetical protein